MTSTSDGLLAKNTAPPPKKGSQWFRHDKETGQTFMFHDGLTSEQHLRWNNLIRPKDDPIWNSIFPPNGYGCKCYTVAVTEARKQKYERDGVPAYNPDTRKTVRLPVQTEAPKPSYRNYFNERKGTLERIPEGITPGFNWNQGQAGRTIPVLQECLKKAQNEMPEAVDSVIRTLQNSTIYRDQLSDFVDQAFKNKAAGMVNNKNTAPVGFLEDRKSVV